MAVLTEVAAEHGLSLTQLRVLGILRDSDPHDGRSVRVTLTESARRLAPVLTAAVGDRITPLTDQLNAAEQRRLTALLTKALDH